MEKTTPKRTLILGTAVGAVLLLAVGIAGAWEWWQKWQLPSGQPHLQGRGVEVNGDSFLVRGANGDLCIVRIKLDTRIRLRNGEAGSITVGRQVSVWHTNNVASSYPSQVSAEWVILETPDP